LTSFSFKKGGSKDFLVYLRDNVEVGDESRLENDWNIRSVKEFDGVRRVLSTIASGFDGQIDAETLEIYDNRKDQNGGQKVHQVGQVLAVESFTESANLVLTGSQQVEKGNHST